MLILRRIRHRDGGGVEQFDGAPSPAPKRCSTALKLFAQVFAQALWQAQRESLAGLAIGPCIQAALSLPGHHASDKALTHRFLAGLISRQYLVDEKTQGDHRWIDALAMASDFLYEDSLQLLGAECLAKGVLSCLGKLLAQLLHVVFEVTGLGTMHMG